MPFLGAEEMVGAWFRQREQAVKWQKEMRRQSRSEGEPWYEVEPEASEADTDHKARKIQRPGEGSKKHETGIHGLLGQEIVGNEEKINHLDEELGEEQLGFFGAESRQGL